MLDFIKPYLHIIEAIAIVALLGWLGYMWHAHNVAQQAVGAQECKQADTTALQEQLASVQAENATLKTKADTAEHANDQELEELRAYRRDHPVKPVWVSNGASHCVGKLPAEAGAKRQDEGANTTTERVQQLPAGDTGASETDIGPMLESLAGKCDEVSASLRAWQTHAF